VEKVDGIWLPKDKKVRNFVDYYWTRYLEIGQETMPF